LKNKKWNSLGVSVIGPGHIKSNTPNQDSFLLKSGNYGTLVVVSDGMGSKPYSDIGSKAVCDSVFEAVKIWNNSKSENINYLLKLIHNLWLIKITPYKAEECAATCLFALVDKKDKLLIAQLGDGILALKNDNELEILNHPTEEDFTNSTTAVGVATSLNEWKYKIVNELPKDSIILLATDGISEDLIAEKIPDFIDYVASFKSLTHVKRKKKLVSMLNNWPTKFHSDDKTLSLIYKN